MTSVRTPSSTASVLSVCRVIGSKTGSSAPTGRTAAELLAREAHHQSPARHVGGISSVSGVPRLSVASRNVASAYCSSPKSVLARAFDTLKRAARKIQSKRLSERLATLSGPSRVRGECLVVASSTRELRPSPRVPVVTTLKSSELSVARHLH